ncbi:class I SAM-dependent methyltransferase [bacterium]|nr:class I SAM-dependent methyltransferase [bacterium]NBX83822.1 class I SAM-dependent methyltransferase [bacterium]
MKATEGHYPSDMFPKLAAAESTHWWFRSRNKVIIWAVQNFVKSCRDFLEIGCGTGFVLEGLSREFPSFTLSGSEYFPEGLSFAKKRVPRAQFKQLDATKMEEKEKYDCIGAFDVLEHIDDDRRVLQNIHRALRPGGYLAITVPQHRWLWSVVDEHAQHVRRYEKADLISKLRAAGFGVVFCSSFVSLLVPLMWLSRLTANKKENFDSMSEFQISGWVNKALEQVMNLELGLLKIGIRLPLGGSLLVVAVKSK